MSQAAIEVRGVGKRYRLGERVRYLTIRESLASAFRGKRARGDRPNDHWALKDVSLTVREGEVVGVVGRNGAGKTTLLRILARITEPTTGVARTRGRVGSLLEVGTGFHPELTGRENVYLNGAILGMTRGDIRRRFEEIVEFAGVAEFLDTPLKRYSSGMYLRLAFAVAAHVEPDIIVVDEVLAVGDADFQNKCLGKMSEFGREGRTVVFVSHDLGAVGRLCRRAYWLEGGALRAEGPSEEIIEQYFSSTVSGRHEAEFAAEPDKPIQLLSVALTDEGGRILEAPRRDERLTLSARLLIRERIPGLDVAFYLRNRKGVQVLSENWSDSGRAPTPADLPKEYDVALTIPPLLASGDYVAGLWIGTELHTFVSREILGFRLWPRPDDSEGSLERQRVVQPPVEWRIGPRGDRDSHG
jgi:ABC-type polysaccharide/polyol phosphate transport system ATPase subunit